MAEKKTTSKTKDTPEPEAAAEETPTGVREHVVGRVPRSYHPAESLRVRRRDAGRDLETGELPKE
jgi:hypothetical protein